MQSTGHSSTQALSFTSMQGSAITYAMSSLLRPASRALPPTPRRGNVGRMPFGSIASEMGPDIISSLIDGRPVGAGPGGGTVTIRDPARLEETVAEAALGDAGTFVDACRRAKEAHAAWAAVPAPV